ncbi:MAG TPA: formate--tetrahydrofolate ligase [Candidatus Ozemobacteraceae bacterium]|nr:formate--tetrahydrofolate ligase [Candidatus Ozemobacteraceae bacterium]
MSKRSATGPHPRPIGLLAADIGLKPDEIELYGPHKAKIAHGVLERLSGEPDAKLVLVTAMTPTPAGEGKTTMTIGLGDALRIIGRRSIICLREPSMGPVFGVKGGAAGGGRAQVVPMEDINLHFTGDIHAVSTAHNLLAALIDNHLMQGNALGLDPRRIQFRRVMDMNDRALRTIVCGLGGPANGWVRETGFDITAASEVMAVLSLASDIADLKKRLGCILVGFTTSGAPVFARDLHAQGAMAAVLRDAFKPNLVQTAEGTPAFIHGGPFANIAHGCNSLAATRLAHKLGDVVLTEAGFATELGAEKFFDIKCRIAGLNPQVVVIVATMRALKYHGGVAKADLAREHMVELSRGFENLAKHIENIRMFNLPSIVAINRFPDDTDAEIAMVKNAVEEAGGVAAVSTAWANGGEGSLELARKVDELLRSREHAFQPLYSLDIPLIEKINVIARSCYGAAAVDILEPAKKALAQFEQMGCGDLPVCMAKTQHSLTDVPSMIGRPRGFKVTVREARLSSGAGFVVALAGEIMTMPGLPKAPAAERIDVDNAGRITGLF